MKSQGSLSKLLVAAPLALAFGTGGKARDEERTDLQ